MLAHEYNDATNTMQITCVARDWMHVCTQKQRRRIGRGDKAMAKGNGTWMEGGRNVYGPLSPVFAYTEILSNGF